VQSALLGSVSAAVSVHACADPTTGRARDYLPGRGWQGYVGVTRSAANVFAGTGQKFERITPGTACAS